MSKEFDAVKFLMNEAERMAFFDHADEADKFRLAAEELKLCREKAWRYEQLNK